MYNSNSLFLAESATNPRQENHVLQSLGVVELAHTWVVFGVPVEV